MEQWVSDVERLMTKIDVDLNTGCWLWQTHIQRTGYAQFTLGGKMVLAHRAAWNLFRGPIPPGKVVCHSCDVRHCVAPSHLFLATARENMQDASRKGRAGRYAKSGRPFVFWPEYEQFVNRFLEVV